jgi:hypothetical protein
VTERIFSLVETSAQSLPHWCYKPNFLIFNKLTDKKLQFCRFDSRCCRSWQLLQRHNFNFLVMMLRRTPLFVNFLPPNRKLLKLLAIVVVKVIVVYLILIVSSSGLDCNDNEPNNNQFVGYFQNQEESRGRNRMLRMVIFASRCVLINRKSLRHQRTTSYWRRDKQESSLLTKLVGAERRAALLLLLLRLLLLVLHLLALLYRVDHKVGQFFFLKSQIFNLCEYFALLKYFF